MPNLTCSFLQAPRILQRGPRDPHAVGANTFLFMLCGNEWVVVVVKGVLLL